MFSQAQALDYLGSKLTQRGKGGFERRRKSKVRSCRALCNVPTELPHLRFKKQHVYFQVSICWRGPGRGRGGLSSCAISVSRSAAFWNPATARTTVQHK